MYHVSCVCIPLEFQSFKILLCMPFTKESRTGPLGKCSAFGGKFKLLRRAPCGGCCVVFSDPPRRRAGSVLTHSPSSPPESACLAFLQSYDEEISKTFVLSGIVSWKKKRKKKRRCDGGGKSILWEGENGCMNCTYITSCNVYVIVP